MPGSIHNPLARGCHRLIRDGAGLVESAQEVLDALVPVASELADFLRNRLAGSAARPHIDLRQPPCATATPTTSPCGWHSATTQPVWIHWSSEPD